MERTPSRDPLGATELAGPGLTLAGSSTDPASWQTGADGSSADVPSHVGRFRLERLLGAGGMGVVYLAHDPDLDRRVAVKLLHQRLTNEPHGQRRMLREAKAMAKLQHPNVVTVYEFGTIDDRMWIAMELVEGTTLSEWRRAEKRTWIAGLDVMLAAGRGLRAAHAAGLVHRDIKPDNIMISEDGRVRVMDFGLVRAHSDGVVASNQAPRPAADLALTGADALVGTPRYMAPEQYRMAEADARSDQYAWCVACWEVVYGQHPFPQRSLVALSDAILAGKITPPPIDHPAPDWLREVLTRGLSVDPAGRFADMRELFAAISANRPTFAALIASENAAALRIEATIGFFLVPSFWVLDWLVLRQWVWMTLGLRLACAVYAAAIIALSIASPRLLQRHVVALAFSYSQLIVWSIAVMCFLHEGYESPYYAGMNLLYLAVGQFFSWNLRTSLTFAGIAYGFYMLPLALGLLEIRDPALALSNQFFILSTILITVISQVHRFEHLQREFAERTLQERLLAEARAHGKA